ncbi:hypothetical protein ACLOJK_027232, partial [Asimina triloba]
MVHHTTVRCRSTDFGAPPSSHDCRLTHRRRVSNRPIRSGQKDGSPHLVQDLVNFINVDHLQAVQAMTAVGFHGSGTGRTTASTDRSQEPISLATPDPATQNPPARRPHLLPSANDSRSRQRSEQSSHGCCSKPTEIGRHPHQSAPSGPCSTRAGSSTDRAVLKSTHLS